MRRTIMMLFLFVMSIGIFAQESELKRSKENIALQLRKKRPSWILFTNLLLINY